MKSDQINFDNIKAAMDEFSKLVKALVEMLKNFIASWQQLPTWAVPTTAAETTTVTE